MNKFIEKYIVPLFFIFATIILMNISILSVVGLCRILLK